MFGKIVNYTMDGSKITIKYASGANGVIDIISPAIARVFCNYSGKEYDSYAIEGDKHVEVNVKVLQQDGNVLISNGTLNIKVSDDFKVDFYDKDMNLLCEDYKQDRSLSEGFNREEFLALIASEGHDVNDEAKRHKIEVIKKLHGDEKFYGMGDKSGFLNKYAYEYENWNSDLPQAHNEDFRALYKSVPFFITLRNESVYGIFFDNHFKSYFNFGKESEDYYFFGADEGNLNYYFIAGDNMPQVVEGYTYLTGRTPLPQRWTLGYHQSRWSYENEQEVRSIADNMKKNKLPIEAIHLDIDYMDSYKVFTWSDKRFPSPTELINDLKEKGIKIVTIIDPGTKVEDGYEIYDEGIKNDYFAKDSDGEIYVNEVWPGDSVFPDFLNSNVRTWWAKNQKKLIDVGVRGIWNDMNEPASFRGPLPMDVTFNKDGEKVYHEEAHNVYGSLMCKATFDGLHDYDQRRPFVITRACYAGVQKYSTVWTGDNQSLWSHLQMAVPQLCNLGLSGIAFAGTDVGGFGADATPELLSRWVQVGCFSPLFRNHCAKSQRRQEPWVLGKECLDINRKYINLRYKILPYLYDLFAECEKTGMPVMRPLVLHYEKDENVKNMNDQFMVGDKILVAPILLQGVTKRIVYLPEGQWIDYWTGEKISGNNYIVKDTPLDVCPIYVKSGSIIPITNAKNTDDISDEELIIECFGNSCSCVHYQDDGEDFKYQKGEYNEYLVEKNGDEFTVSLLHEGYSKKYSRIKAYVNGQVVFNESINL